MATSGLVQLLHSVAASADLSAAQYKFVNFDSSAELQLAGATEAGYVLQDKPDAAGINGTILLIGKGKVTAGETILAGEFISPDASGDAAVYAVGDVACGIALEDALDGDLFLFVTVQTPVDTIT